MKHEKQTFLDNLYVLRTKKGQPSEIIILNWNIRNPSVKNSNTAT